MDFQFDPLTATSQKRETIVICIERLRRQLYEIIHKKMEKF
jgi:hypothetical protein